MGASARRLGLVVRLGAGAAWAAGLVLAGLWVLLPAPAGQGVVRLPAAAGVALICGGEFVFMVLVADRVFPRAQRRAGWWLEMILLLGFLVAGGAAVVALLRGE